MRQLLAELPLPRDGKCTKGRAARSVTINIAESPLSWLHARKMIDDRQFAAGELLRRDYERAGLPRRVTMLWDAPPPGKHRSRIHGHDAPEVGRLDAKARFLAAIRRAGKGLGDILWRAVCAGERIPAVEREFGWPSKAGKLVLALALDRVADYYRVP